MLAVGVGSSNMLAQCWWHSGNSSGGKRKQERERERKRVRERERSTNKVTDLALYPQLRSRQNISAVKSRGNFIAFSHGQN